MDEVQVEAANMISTVLQIEHFGPLVLCIISGRFSILLQVITSKGRSHSKKKKSVKFHTWGRGWSGQNWVIFTLFSFFSFMS